MRISILVPDISSNAMARTCPIAQALSQDHEIEIIGFDPGDGFFEPYRDEFAFTAFETGRTPLSLSRNIYRAQKEVTGDVCYAFRPLLGSLGVGYLEKLRRNTPLILDVEDIVRYKNNNYPSYKRLYHILRNGSPAHGVYTKPLERRRSKVDEVTVTSTYLQEDYGGTILPYGPDENEFNPTTVTPHPEIASQYQDTTTLGFVGTIRPHKGLSDLAKAISKVDDDVRLVVAGYDPHDELDELRSLSDGAVDYIGPISHEKVPSFLLSIDIVPIPQKQTPYTKAQIPNKLFEAMAMGKAIIASEVGDIPRILGECGIIVPPDNTTAQLHALQQLCNDGSRRKSLGQSARIRYVEKFGRSALRDSLNRIIGPLQRK